MQGNIVLSNTGNLTALLFKTKLMVSLFCQAFTEVILAPLLKKILFLPCLSPYLE